jgi:hypothetical protein
VIGNTLQGDGDLSPIELSIIGGGVLVVADLDQSLVLAVVDEEDELILGDEVCLLILHLEG